MYKRFTLAELTSIQNNFIPHLYNIIKREKCQGANDFFKMCFKEGNDVLYFYRSDPAFRMRKIGNDLILADEIDKIEIVVPFDNKSQLQSLIIKYISKKERQV